MHSQTKIMYYNFTSFILLVGNITNICTVCYLESQVFAQDVQPELWIFVVVVVLYADIC